MARDHGGYRPGAGRKKKFLRGKQGHLTLDPSQLESVLKTLLDVSLGGDVAAIRLWLELYGQIPREIAERENTEARTALYHAQRRLVEVQIERGEIENEHLRQGENPDDAIDLEWDENESDEGEATEEDSDHPPDAPPAAAQDLAK